ncbi:unnamed protein product [Arctogadus glacialis]
MRRITLGIKPRTFWSGSRLPCCHWTILPHPTVSSYGGTRMLHLHSTTMHLLFSRTHNHRSFCYDITNLELLYQFLVYGSVISVVMFVLPFMLVMVCYGLMVRKLLEPSWGSAEGQQGLPAAHRTKQKSVKMIIIVLVTFMFCFLPYQLIEYLRFVIYYSGKITCKMGEAYFIAFQVTWLMASANSIMDPILYFMVGQDFRKTMMKKKQKKSEKNLPKSENTVLMASP